MIELDSVLIVLMIEALAVLLLLVVVAFIFHHKRRSKERTDAHDLIDKLEEMEVIRTKKLGDRINEYCQIDNEKLRVILKEIKLYEQELYQQILHIFLKRDGALLKEIDHYVNRLSMPYCNILRDSLSADNGDHSELEEAKAQISRLKKEGSVLAEQLQMAMQTMDEISSEYTRVFSGTQSELELENSSKKMMRIFADAEKTIRSSFKELKNE